MIKTVIFDLDGVIIDSEPIHFSVEKNLFKKLGAHITDENHLEFVGTSSKNMWSKIKGLCEIEYSIDELVEMTDQKYLDTLKKIEGIDPIPGVRNLIVELFNNNYKLAIASSSSRIIIDTVLEKFDLAKYFQILMSGADLVESKPDPEIFITASRLTNTNTTDCLVIEDSENGIKAAKSAGMLCIAYKNPNSGNQDLGLADILVNNFETLNLTEIIKQLENPNQR